MNNETISVCCPKCGGKATYTTIDGVFECVDYAARDQRMDSAGQIADKHRYIFGAHLEAFRRL